MNIKGIDVSSYQGVIDWKKAVDAGVEFAILKVIRKDLNPDKQFENNWKGCTAAGVPVQGVYNYSYATTVEKAKSDAIKVLKILAGRKPMVWLDVEDTCLKELGSRLVDIINEYGAVIKAAGLQFGVYTGFSFYNSHLRQYAAQIPHPFWIARYPSSSAVTFGQVPAASKKPAVSNELYGWQYSSNGKVPGINGSVDLDELYVAVESENVMPAVQETLHKAGEAITVSSYYISSTDGIEKAIIKNATGIITRVKPGTHNPYCFGRNGVVIGWCNDGDIRSADEVKPMQATAIKKHKVRTGDTLSAIAKKHGTTVSKIVSGNKTKYPKISANYIVVGWVLKV